MARRSLRDRILTPVVARAMTSPAGILAAGAAAAAAIAAGLPLAVAPLAGAAAWAVRVAVAVPPAPAGPQIDPRRLREPWRDAVLDALDAAARFRRVVESSQPGPMRERLAAIASRIDDGVDECWRVAQQGHALAGAWDALDVAGVQADLERVLAQRRSSEAAGSSPTTAALDRAAAALTSQLDSARRLSEIARTAADRLTVLNAQLDEAVARAVEVSIGTGTGAAGADPLSADVDHLVTELEALRQALEEGSGPQAAPGL